MPRRATRRRNGRDSELSVPLDRPSVSGRDVIPETAAGVRPAETPPELGAASRLLVLAIAAVLRLGLWRSRALGTAFLRRTPEAGAMAWRALQQGAARGTTLFTFVAAAVGRRRVMSQRQ